MPVRHGKSSPELETLQSSQEEVAIATHSSTEWCNSWEDRGHHGAGDGMGLLFSVRVELEHL